jgi:hypothetical protein
MQPQQPQQLAKYQDIPAKCLARLPSGYRIRPEHFNFVPAFGAYDADLAQVCTVAPITAAERDLRPELKDKTHWLLDGNHRRSMAGPDDALPCKIVPINVTENHLSVVLMSVKTNVGAHTVSKVRSLDYL